ncbi:AAA domain-containing protein [Rhodococcus sp. 14-2483-1-2]|uniref:AAA domain-containing protein n=1 Tax=Rhodococcus sp. 14-2483-1-2 TaxID=2023147 RepID=UPI000B9AB2CC|nr:AAA domain-containing protein [Rhodococcus sp. 14-2483-1-2]OZF30741.1 AAA family ATPase [Rhodococcus sp. 14-2483-1-2]
MTAAAATGREHDDELKSRVQRLLRFLREIVEARSNPVLRFDDHVQVEWVHAGDVPMQLDPRAKQGGVVLRAPRIAVDEPPEPPALLSGWLDPQIVADSRYRELELADASSVTSRRRAEAQESDADFDIRKAYEIKQAFEEYSESWKEWAQEDRDRRPQAALYQALQLMMQELASRPESIELVVASGLLTSSNTDPQRSVRTHLITQSASIERDVRTGDLLVRLAASTTPRLEDGQLLTGSDDFDTSGSVALARELHDTVTSPIGAGVEQFLRNWAAKVPRQEIEVLDRLGPPGALAYIDDDRTLTVSPALVLRVRDSFALVEYYEQMIADLEFADSPVPLGLAQLVDAIEPADRMAWLERTGAGESAALAEDPLFPLPANAEQSQIIERLGRDSGVVVEGPPGTGKTHTIANLMSGLLARGQRVLVTSEKSQALRVLRDKLPPELQELCVSITDLSRGGSDELNRSVAKIAERKTSFDEASEVQKIEALTTQRASALARRAELLDRVSALRESETVVHEYVSDGYDGTVSSIVRKVKAAEGAHEWLPGPLLADRPPLDGVQVDQLRKLIAGSDGTRELRSRQVLPRPETILPNSAELTSLCRRASAQIDDLSPQAADLVALLDGVEPAVSSEIEQLCEELAARVRAVVELDGSYPRLTDSVLSGEAAHLWSRVSGIDAMVETAAASDRYVGGHDVQCSSSSPAALTAMDAFAGALESGIEWKPRFRRSEEQKAVEALDIVATVDGQPATTAMAARLVAEHIRALETVQTAAVLLADLAIVVPLDGTRSIRVNNVARIADRLGLVSAVVAARDALVHRLYTISPAAPWIRSLADAQEVAGAADAIAARIDIDAARAELDALQFAVATRIDAGPSPEGSNLVSALSTADPLELAAAVAAYSQACSEQEDQLLLESMSASLSEVAPALFDLVESTAGDVEWDELSWQMSKAWAWRRAREWVGEQHHGGLEQQLEADLAAADTDIAYLTTRLAAASAWRNSLERMTAVEVRALQTYREHISSIGSGAGKYAETYRSAARSAMREAQSAVPAWVMPLSQVLASIPPVPGSFDVVIVDEASQADITSLFLLYLAPRVIVVGDDRQCAPADVPQTGTLEDVFDRLDVYLPDLPEHVRATLTPRSSLFSMLRTRFGQVVRLREHFRSMPEIINWSSQQFYGDSPLVPVRQFGADRLPPLRHTYVRGATVTGKNASLVNRTEAIAIAEQIAHCLEDSAYDNRTFGVVVLQGQSQVDEIRNELIKRIGIEQWEQRRLRVGTPPDFQGDERNVVFLSMVVAPDQNFATLTANQYKRRFNVAASRAQDQLWLFHSVTVDRLKRADLRNSLLSYVTSVSPAPADPMPVDVSREIRKAPFETLLEQQLWNDLVERGFHVNPGVEVNNRRLALVVTGDSSRLAVECDGDTFLSTPAQRLADLQREQELKRCGWTFWRVRESEYYLDRDAALESLWATLARLGIKPNSVVVEGLESSDEAWTPVPLESSQFDDSGVFETSTHADSSTRHESVLSLWTMPRIEIPTGEPPESDARGGDRAGSAPSTTNGSGMTNGTGVENGSGTTNGSRPTNGSGTSNGAAATNGATHGSGTGESGGSRGTARPIASSASSRPAMTNGSTPAQDAESDASARVRDSAASSESAADSSTEFGGTANSTTAATDRVGDADETVASDEAADSVEAAELDGSDPADTQGDSTEATTADVEPSGGLEAPEDEGIAEHELPLNGLRGYTTRRRP